MEHPIAPTVFLPPLIHLDDYTPWQVLESLHMLKRLYFPHSLSSQPSSAGALIECRGRRAFSHEHVPDSGYASAEEDFKSIVERDDSDAEGDEVFLELLRADDLERGFAIKWLTGFLKRADSWMTTQSIEDIEGDMFSELNEEASALLSRIAGYGEEDDSRNEVALTRQFCFPANTTATQEFIVLELNDAPLDAVDHTAVGLQSWASSIVLARQMCAHPRRYLFLDNLDMSAAHPSHEPPQLPAKRVLELGAGTGLLSIVTAKLYRQLRCPAHVKATDYHPMVLENLIENVRSNFNSDTRLSSVTNGMEGLEEANVEVEKLDWSSPPEVEEEEKYDIVLAADVIYDPRHAHWICDCVMKSLKKPMPRIGGESGVFWLAMPLRSTGRHEGMERTVEDAFPVVDGLEKEGKGEHRLVVVSKEELGRQEGIGRADECGYTLFEIRWA
ncbi:hypothetical protein EDD16DRAFT_1480029 [Pisolithus croceorrhizus]|nr:hypothetical protein EDD16DRAFT_1480029 [Pisolithus croceorrhizus]KAI6120390.1 hypothetical protein EV401DRAFT_2262665 [Pisolithus croceorrhizus]KAI6166331.1 hypothetical protein EDD17DRAFT_1470948 [Pisolithus thermaeus]